MIGRVLVMLMVIVLLSSCAAQMWQGQRLCKEKCLVGGGYKVDTINYKIANDTSDAIKVVHQTYDKPECWQRTKMPDGKYAYCLMPAEEHVIFIYTASDGTPKDLIRVTEVSKPARSRRYPSICQDKAPKGFIASVQKVLFEKGYYWWDITDEWDFYTALAVV